MAETKTVGAIEAPALEALLVAAALAGGAAILPIYKGPIMAREKSDASPVTFADEAAEAAILACLAAAAPNIPVIAEEAVSRGELPPTDGLFFLVDPLDGTKEFIAQLGEFTVNIALVENGAPVAGVVYAPAIGRLFLGVHGASAREARVVDGAISDWRVIAARTPPPEGLVAVASRSHAGPDTDAFLARHPVVARVSAGSSLKFCLVAAGEADVYPRMGRTMEWDTAAGHAVLTAAGGRVARLDGTPLTYGKRNRAEDTDFANPWFVGWGLDRVPQE